VFFVTVFIVAIVSGATATVVGIGIGRLMTPPIMVATVGVIGTIVGSGCDWDCRLAVSARPSARQSAHSESGCSVDLRPSLWASACCRFTLFGAPKGQEKGNVPAELG
jgi:hypothetical protein